MSPVVSVALANLLVDQNLPTNVLSGRELEIFIAYAKKENLDDLATRLEITDRYIQNVISKIAKKLGLHRSDFREFAKKNGLIE
jgi:hypothetical protein